VHIINFESQSGLPAGKFSFSLAQAENSEEFYITEVMPEKLRMNLEYVRKNNLWIDLKIIFITVASLFYHGKEYS